MMSSHYGLNRLGYTRATMVNTMSGDGVNRSKSLKLISVQIVPCNSGI